MSPATRRARGLQLAAAALLTIAAAAPAGAQTPVLDLHEHLDFDRPEAWALKYFASTSLLTGFGTPGTERPGSVELGFEVDPIPEIGAQDAQVGFRGSKQEDVNKAPVLARPRLSVGLPRGFELTLAWVPPVEVFGVKPNLLSAGVGRSFELPAGWRWGARVFGQTGSLTSDITCPREVAARGLDPETNPYGCRAASSDEVFLRYVGAELSTSWGETAGRRLVPHLAVAGTYLDTELQVDARTYDVLDHTRLTAHGTTWSAAAGARYRFAGGFDLAAEVFYSPLSVRRPNESASSNDPLLNARTLLVYRWR